MKEKKQTLFIRVLKYIKNDVWEENISTLSNRKSFLIRTLRIIILAVRGFKEDRCMEKASALTYYSLLSIVPIAAMAFGFAKGFGFEKQLEAYVYSAFSDKQEVAAQILEFSNNMLMKTSGGIIAGVGFIVLVWSVIKVLGNIEGAFNQIWSINKQRTFLRKISDYMTIMIFAPILLIISKSTTNAITNYLEVAANGSDFISNFFGLASFGMKLIPYSLVWLAFTFIYMILPNTRVKFAHAFKGGVIAGIIFQITQYLYVSFQIGVSNYNAIFGSFAALPLFLIWMQTSWVIVILGAEIANANQNIRNFELDIETSKLSTNLRERLSLFVLHKIVKQFQQGAPALTSMDLSDILDIPHRVTKHILIHLVNANLVHETKTDNEKMFAYVPAIAIDTLSVKIAIEKMRSIGTNTLKNIDSEVFDTITPELINKCTQQDLLVKNL